MINAAIINEDMATLFLYFVFWDAAQPPTVEKNKHHKLQKNACSFCHANIENYLYKLTLF